MKKGCVWLLGLVAIGALFGFLVSSAWTYVMPKKYESETVIEVKPRPVGASFIGPGNDSSNPAMRMTPQFLATEFEKITSRKALEKVVGNLSLTTRWRVDREDAIRILKAIVSTQNIHGTDLIIIRVRHSNNMDARDIAETVALAYREYRNEIEKRDQEAVLNELSRAIREQEDKLEERRKLLASIVKTKGIIYKGHYSYYGSGDDGAGDDDESRMAAVREFEKLKAECVRLKSQIEGFDKYEGESRIVYAAGLGVPDNPVRSLFLEYHKAKTKLEGMKQPSSGMGPDHPAILAATKEIESLKHEMDEGIAALRVILNAQLDLVQSQIQGVEKNKNQTREEAINRGLDAQDYVDAKRDFEANQELLQDLKLKKVSMEIASRIPFQSVEIHDAPVIAQAPLGPNVSLNLTLGTLVGASVFPLAALLVMGVMRIARGNARAGER